MRGGVVLCSALPAEAACRGRLVIQPNLVLAEVYSLTLAPMDTEAHALIQILQSILDH